MYTTKLSSKYQIVVPREVRNAMRLKAGQKVMLQSIDDNKALIVKLPSSHTENLKGLGKEVWKKLGGGAKYIKQERAVWLK